MENLQLKRYTIKKRIGEGGMADVYWAYDNVLERNCAIKIMKSDLSGDPIARMRFRREADAAATLQHPNIVTIYDVGESNNRPFIVMEYVKGPTLKQLIGQRGAIEKREAIFIATQICEGLKVAHQAGVIHRDVKPHNILIKADSTAKITDFGIASVQGAIQLTQHDSVMGSVHYLAPECSRGEGASAQSDIYSLGIVLYEMLIGDLPYKGDSAVTVAMAHMKEPMPSIRERNNSIEQSIENIIIKATAKNKELRYQNADEMLQDLKECLLPQHANDKKIVLASKGGSELDQTKVFTDNRSNASNNNSPKNKILIGVIIAATIGLILLGLSTLLNPSPDMITVEDVSGMMLEEAQTTLKNQGLIINENILYELSSEQEKDRVIRTTPAANTEVEEGKEITLVVSLGEGVTVENYIGKTLQEVENIFNALDNVEIEVEYQENNDYEPNTIISQLGLLEGDVVNPQEEYTLELVVAKAEIFPLPNVIGKNYEEAKAQLEEMGVKVEVIAKDSLALSNEEWRNTTFDVVTKMTPEANTPYNPEGDSVVTLEYWTKSERTIVNKTALEDKLEEARNIDKTPYTAESLYSLSLAMTNAENVLYNENPTQQNIDAALETLQESIDLLTELPTAPMAPKPNEIKAGDERVTGIADPNSTVVIFTENSEVLAQGKTDSQGKFEIIIEPQEAPTLLYLLSSNSEGLESDRVAVLVSE